MYFSAHTANPTDTRELMQRILEQLKVANVLLHSGLNVPDEPSDILTDVQNEATEA